MASEEIAKANQIILKQSQELQNQKKTIAWRTEVALQQEKAINEKEKLLSIRAEELQHAHDTIQQLREEIPQQLQSMRHFAKELELKYTNRKLVKQFIAKSTSRIFLNRNHHTEGTFVVYQWQGEPQPQGQSQIEKQSANMYIFCISFMFVNLLNFALALIFFAFI